MEIPPKVSFSILRAKRAMFQVYAFFQPFLPFEKLFRPSKLCLYSNLLNKKHSQKGLQSLQKDKKGFANRKKKMPSSYSLS